MRRDGKQEQAYEESGMSGGERGGRGEGSRSWRSGYWYGRGIEMAAEKGWNTGGEREVKECE